MLKIVNFRVGSIASKSIFGNNGGCLVLPYVQNRTMTSKKFRVKKNKPAPFPYQEKTYHRLWCLFDHTFKRFDENTKLIVVEGPIGSGKHELAKRIAEEFEMKYVPDIMMDFDYINPYGYDMRNLDPKLPLSCQTFDENDFCRDPFHVNAAGYQAIKYRLRWTHYWHILEHLLNTGQGVVTVRSPFSTNIFTNAMRQCNYISEAAKFYCSEAVRHSIFYLHRPHLVIYLDVPVDKTIENIKARNREAEVKGKALTPEFLQNIEDGYKNVYLREASIHSMILHYNWSDGGDSEVVVEDIERLDFEKYLDEDSDEMKLEDWRMSEDEADWERWRYGTDKRRCLNAFENMMILDAPEMLIPGEDIEVWEKVWYNAPGMKYARGYNIDRGDNVWFKNRPCKNYSDIPAN